MFDHPAIGRCQLHKNKIRNVQDHLPKKLRGPVGQRIRQAYHADSALAAQALLEALAAGLDKTHPGAAGSLLGGMAETLTVLRLGVPPTPARTLGSTNAVESMIGICRDHSRNVKRQRDGQMALRWCAAGMIEASRPRRGESVRSRSFRHPAGQFLRRLESIIHWPPRLNANSRAPRRRTKTVPADATRPS